MEHEHVTLAVIAILGIAVYRLTRVLTIDTITDPFRAALYDWAWAGPPDRPRAKGRVRGWLYELATCPHCLGVWIAAGAVAVFATYDGAPPNLAAWLVVVFAVAGVQSVLASVVGRLER